MDAVAPPPTKRVTRRSTLANLFPSSSPSRTNIDDSSNCVASQLTEITKRPMTVPASGTSQPKPQIGSRAGATKNRKGVLGFVCVLLGLSKASTNSTLDNSVNSSHAGFSSSSGEPTGLLDGWKRWIRNSVVSRRERKGNSRAGFAGSVMEVESSVSDEVDTVAIPPREDASSPRTLQSPVCHSAAVPIRDPHELFKRSTLAPPNAPSNLSLTSASHRPVPVQRQIFSPMSQPTPQHLLPTSPARNKHIPGSVTTKGPRPSEPQSCLSPVSAKRSQKSPASSVINQPSKERGGDRERSSPQLSTAADKSHQVPSAAGAGTLRKERDQVKDSGLIQRLQRICTEADPTKLYRNFVEIRAW